MYQKKQSYTLETWLKGVAEGTQYLFRVFWLLSMFSKMRHKLSPLILARMRSLNWCELKHFILIHLKIPRIAMMNNQSVRILVHLLLLLLTTTVQMYNHPNTDKNESIYIYIILLCTAQLIWLTLRCLIITTLK